VYAIGKGVAVRGVVATLNSARLNGEEPTHNSATKHTSSTHWNEEAERWQSGDGGNRGYRYTGKVDCQETLRKTDWTAFLEEEEVRRNYESLPSFNSLRTMKRSDSVDALKARNMLRTNAAS
jgi:hypothetical protein